MSIDRSLKVKGALTRHRNVLTRPERIEKLQEEDRWQQGDSVTGLPKVANRKTRVAKETKPDETVITEQLQEQPETQTEQ